MTGHSLIELEAVLAIVRFGSFRAAELDLGMSTTAISNTVGKLERELDVRLFNRTTRSVSKSLSHRMSSTLVHDISSTSIAVFEVCLKRRCGQKQGDRNAKRGCGQCPCGC